MIQILPAILATNEQEYQEKLNQIESSPALEMGWVQIDLMDNKFVQNQSVAPEVVKKYSTKLKIEAQLMVEDPIVWVKDFSDFPIKRFIAPIELEESVLDKFVELVKSANAEVGFSVNPETELNKLGKYLKSADAVLLMSVHPGFGTQDFIPETVDKLKAAAVLREQNHLKFIIGVDGGVSRDNVLGLVQSGVDYLVIGSHLLKGDIDENLEKIWEAIQ